MGHVGFLTADASAELCQREHMKPISRFFLPLRQLHRGSDSGIAIRTVSTISATSTISVGSSSLAMISARLSANLPAAN